MGEQEQSCGRVLVACMLCCVLIPGAIAAMITLIVIPSISKDPVYSVAITGVTGLDDPVPSPPSPANLSSSLSPVFNLTVHIDNARGHMSSYSEACIGRLSTVSVSYEGAVLARGPVPEFCAKERKVRERGARAWGQNVALPPFLLDQLAGELAVAEAAVDVKVTTPAESNLFGDSVLLCSQVKIVVGGPAPCRIESVASHGQQAAPESTTG